ncbi:MAG: hypothetical protein JKY44_06255 [Flavobacteriaceae bacterium]|nr:hypothetical protein [Flavobacteriaceae bacterium]
MAHTYYSNTKDSITFNEFIDTISKVINFQDEDSLLECVNPLLKLSNNSSFFTEYLNQQLNLNMDEFQKGNSYSEQGYKLYECKDFFIRITYWPKISTDERFSQPQSDLFSYDMAHDHNFPLLTAGYKGDGYTTKLWEYEYENVIGYKNEKVDMKFLEETTLHQGKALYYRPSRDIHSQIPPKIEDSLAINIILNTHNQFEHRQYEFDTNQKKIKDIIYGSSESKFNIIKLATLFNNDETVGLLTKIASKHKIPQVRQESLISLSNIEKSNEVWKIGLKDKDSSVVELCKLNLENFNI